MTDDLTRQRFWSWNNTKPDPRPRMPRVSRSRSRSRGRSLRSTAEPTHVLLVRVHGNREWSIVADTSEGRIRYVSGSEAFCSAELATRAKHFTDDEFRVMPWPEAKRELRRKTWSVNDEDHIPTGAGVMLRRAPGEIHPSLAQAHAAFGIPRESESRRTGVVTHRWHRSGDFMVRLDGTTVSVSVKRADLVYPVPDNLVAFERRTA